MPAIPPSPGAWSSVESLSSFLSVSVLSKSLSDAIEAAADYFVSALALMHDRGFRLACQLDSLPRTSIAAIADRHGGAELGLHADRSDDPLRVFRVADIYGHRSPHQRGELLDRVRATLTRQSADVGFDGAQLDRSWWAASKVARDALREGTAGAALLAVMADPWHGWLFRLLIQE